MYRDGMVGGGAGGAPPGALRGISEFDDFPGFEGLDIDELEPMTDELLQWTEHLDFDNYLADWTSTACSRALVVGSMLWGDCWSKRG